MSILIAKVRKPLLLLQSANTNYRTVFNTTVYTPDNLFRDETALYVTVRRLLRTVLQHNHTCFVFLPNLDPLGHYSNPAEGESKYRSRLKRINGASSTLYNACFTLVCIQKHRVKPFIQNYIQGLHSCSSTSWEYGKVKIQPNY